MTRGTRMARLTVRITSWPPWTSADSSAQLSKSKVLNSGSMTRATPRYSSENARRTLVT